MSAPRAYCSCKYQKRISDSKTHDRIDRSRTHGGLGYSIVDLQTTQRNAQKIVENMVCRVCTIVVTQILIISL